MPGMPLPWFMPGMFAATPDVLGVAGRPAYQAKGVTRTAHVADATDYPGSTTIAPSHGRKPLTWCGVRLSGQAPVMVHSLLVLLFGVHMQALSPLLR